MKELMKKMYELGQQAARNAQIRRIKHEREMKALAVIASKGVIRRQAI